MGLPTGTSPALVAWGEGGDAPQPGADVNRDGAVSEADEGREDAWTPGRGAIFLPTVDDDERQCKVSASELEAIGPAVGKKFAACNDSADERIKALRATSTTDTWWR